MMKVALFDAPLMGDRLSHPAPWIDSKNPAISPGQDVHPVLRLGAAYYALQRDPYLAKGGGARGWGQGGPGLFLPAIDI